MTDPRAYEDAVGNAAGYVESSSMDCNVEVMDFCLDSV